MKTLKEMQSATPRELQTFAGLQMVFFAILVTVWHDRRAPLTFPMIIMGVSTVVGIGGLLRPEAIRPIYWLWMTLAFPIGWVVSRLVLALVFYGIFTPIGLVLRLTGRDPMQRQWDRTATTYWVRRPPARDPASYFRQF